MVYLCNSSVFQLSTYWDRQKWPPFCWQQCEMQCPTRNIKQNRHHFKYECKVVVTDRFISNWHNNLLNTEINPGLITYQTIKKSFRLKPYLYLVREASFPNAIAQILASSHTLVIERGHHTRPKTPIQEILCSVCGVIEDGAHFILSCHINKGFRVDQMNNIDSSYPEFRNMTENEQIYFIFNNEDQRIFTWFGIF